jgi:type II secretory pathway component PulC
MANTKITSVRAISSITANAVVLMTALSVCAVFAEEKGQSLHALELSGVVMNQPNSVAVFFDKYNNTEVVLREGNEIADCVLDDIRRNQVYFYCKDQRIHTLALRAVDASKKDSGKQTVWSNQVAISSQQQFFSTATTFADQFALTPYFEQGHQAAFEIGKVNTAGFDGELDLQEGDIIISINGVSATDHSRLDEALKQTQYTRTVNLELIREGTRYHKSYLLADN